VGTKNIMVMKISVAEDPQGSGDRPFWCTKVPPPWPSAEFCRWSSSWPLFLLLWLLPLLRLLQPLNTVPPGAPVRVSEGPPTHRGGVGPSERRLCGGRAGEGMELAIVRAQASHTGGVGKGYRGRDLNLFSSQHNADKLQIKKYNTQILITILVKSLFIILRGSFCGGKPSDMPREKMTEWRSEGELRPVLHR